MQGLAVKLTLLRVYLIPLFILSYYLFHSGAGRWITLSIYIIAAVTDYLDGKIARMRAEVSSLGAFLDPVADKLMVCAILIVVLHQHQDMWLMVCSLIIIGREIWVSALREWLAGLGLREVVAVSKVGKWKTTFQMAALGFLIYQQPLLGLPVWQIGQGLLMVAAVLTLYSMWGYTRAALRYLRNDKL